MGGGFIYAKHFLFLQMTDFRTTFGHISNSYCWPRLLQFDCLRASMTHPCFDWSVFDSISWAVSGHTCCKNISVLLLLLLSLLLLLLLSLLLLLLLSLLQAWLLTPTCFHQNPSINCSIVDRRTKTPRNSLFLVFLWKVDLRRFWSLPWMIFFPTDIGGWIFLLIFNRCWVCQRQFRFFLFGSH